MFRRVGFVIRAALFFEKPGRPAGQPRLRNHRNHLGCETIETIKVLVLDIGYWTLLQKICFSNSHSPKVLKPKTLPPNCLTHYQSAVSIFPSKKIDSKGICQKIQKSKNPVLIIPYFPLKEVTIQSLKVSSLFW